MCVWTAVWPEWDKNRMGLASCLYYFLIAMPCTIYIICMKLGNIEIENEISVISTCNILSFDFQADAHTDEFIHSLLTNGMLKHCTFLHH